MQTVYTGTMAWAYDDWRGPFYARDTPSAKLLTEFARVFPTVELDTTTYGAPRESTLDSWYAQTPEGFLFSAKIPKAITHERRLVNAAEAALDFGHLLRARLQEKLAAILIQLPPDFTADYRPTFDTFIQRITDPRAADAPVPWVVEFRHASWKDTDALGFLTKRGVHCATTDRLDLGGPLRYVRLLGTEHSVARFDERQFDRSEELAAWATRLDAARQEIPVDGRPLLVYARNFFEGHSPATLRVLREMLGLPNVSPPGQSQMSLF